MAQGSKKARGSKDKVKTGLRRKVGAKARAKAGTKIKKKTPARTIIPFAAAAAAKEDVGTWVIKYFEAIRPPPITTDILLKDLKYADQNDIGTFTHACQAELAANVAPVEMQAEFNKKKETVGGLISFLSSRIPAAPVTAAAATA